MAKTLLSKTPAGKLVIAVLDRGWVFLGRATEDEFTLTLEDAKCVRVWGTTRGIGQLALEGPQPETILDRAGTVSVPKGSVVCVIDAQESVWTGH